MALMEVLEKQLEIEKHNAEQKLTSANLDTLYKITSLIHNLKCMESGAWDGETIAEAAESVIKKYSNGRYDHNIDTLYDTYLAAKQAYQTNGDSGHKDKLMEAVGRLMVEVYDMLSAMVLDADFQLERQEIQRQIKRLAEM